MHFKFKKLITLLVCVTIIFFITPTSFATNSNDANNFQAKYKVNNQNLYVSIQPSLYNYYSNLSHAVNVESDYANFVTPQTVASIAEKIQNTTQDQPYSNETFANEVLFMVHQIPYVVLGAKYPVETMVNNSGDCVGLSILAASIMQAGGLDVILIDYTGINPGHMNIGVYLPYTPIYHTQGLTPTHFDYNNKTYWTAEATPAENWKVGDQPDSLNNAQDSLISLENTTQSSPAEVSSSLDTPLIPSSITVDLSQAQINNPGNTRALIISGSISPTLSERNITIYIGSGATSDYIQTVTNNSGGYALIWNFTSSDTYYVTTSWSGDSNYAGADSETLSIFAGPQSYVEFQSSDYSYIYGDIGIPGDFALQPMVGVNNFLTVPLRSNISLSYNFKILQAGQTISNVGTKTLTIPEQTLTIRTGPGRQVKTIIIPQETITVPTNVPISLEPLALPSDFNQTINNQFCFIIQNSNGTYTLNFNGLNSYAASNLQYDSSTATFVNVSENVSENAWYNLSATISNEGLTENLFDTNGTLIKSIEAPYNGNSSETALVITNNVDAAVVFKDLTIQALNSTAHLPQSNVKITDYNALIPYVGLAFVVVAASVAIAVVLKKSSAKKKTGFVKSPPVTKTPAG